MIFVLVTTNSLTLITYMNCIKSNTIFINKTSYQLNCEMCRLQLNILSATDVNRHLLEYHRKYLADLSEQNRNRAMYFNIIHSTNLNLKFYKKKHYQQLQCQAVMYIFATSDASQQKIFTLILIEYFDKRGVHASKSRPLQY